MGEEEKFDVIVVGGGPAGLTAAYIMAKAGLEVMVLERGDYCGSKNMFGGIFFTNVFNEIMPDFKNDAPLERVVTKRRWSFLTPSGELGGGLGFSNYKDGSNNSYTVLRAKFDKWFAEKTEEAGAMVITGAVVDDFIMKDGKVAGVKARMEDGDIYGDVVVLADGVNSLLAEKLGMHDELDTGSTIVGVKEVIKLDEEKIADRFGLNGAEGAAYEYFGLAALGAIGSGFIYTNKDTLSVGVGAEIKSLLELKLNPNDVLEAFKEHPAIAPLIKGGEQKEYAAHLIPDGGYYKLSKPVKDNVVVVGDAAGFVNATLFHEGTNLAMETGRLAGETVKEAKERGNIKDLCAYEKKLKKSFPYRDLKQFRKLSKTLNKNKQIFDKYPALMEELVSGLFAADGVPKGDKEKKLVKKLLKKESIFRLVKTGLDMRRVIL